MLRDPERVGEAYVAFLKRYGPDALRAGVTTKAAVCKTLIAHASVEWLRENGLPGKHFRRQPFHRHSMPVDLRLRVGPFMARPLLQRPMP